MTEKGPTYNVPLLDTLPLGFGGMIHQLPSSQDLEDVRTISQRTAAGYEVLLKHYHEAQARLKENRITTRCPACHFATLVINDGQLLCTAIECPDPTMIHRLGQL